MDETRDFSGQLNKNFDSEKLNRNGKPFFWRIANGVIYSEMPYSRSIRPPLLSDWESERVKEFKNRDRRGRWLAGRALAKVLVKERLGIHGIIEIREGADGEPLVFSNGFPIHNIWLGISVRHNRICCVIADRPVSIEIRKASSSEVEVVDGFVGRSEQRSLRKILGCSSAARSSAWAIKEAAQRAARVRTNNSIQLSDIQIDPSLGVQVGNVSELDVLALRYIDEVAIAIVGKFLLEENRTVKIVLDEIIAEQNPPKIQAAIERSVARARRIAEAKLRWQQLRFDT